MPPKKDKKAKAKRVVKRRAPLAQAQAVVNLYHHEPYMPYPHYADKGHHVPFTSGDKGARSAIETHTQTPRPQMVSTGTQYPIVLPTRAELQAQGRLPARRASVDDLQILALQGQSARSRGQEARREIERLGLQERAVSFTSSFL